MTIAIDQASTLRQLVQRRPAPATRPPVLAISSGKGGVGKTVLAVNLALRLAAMGKRTLLVDLDPGLANVDVYMRLQARRTIDDVLAGRCSAEQAVLVGPSGLLILPGGNLCAASLEGARASTALPRERSGPGRVLDALGPLHRRLDLIVLDTGAGVGPWVLGALERADQTIVVTQTDPVSVTDAYALLKVCRAIDAAREPGIAVNRVADKRDALVTATRLRTVAKRFLGFEPELLGWLHEQPAVQRSMQNQIPFMLELGSEERPVLDIARLAASSAARLLTKVP